MAMTMGDAADVQTLARWILGDTKDLMNPERLGDDARAALIRLTDRAHTKLMAGVQGGYVRAAWPSPGLPFGCRDAAGEVER